MPDPNTPPHRKRNKKFDIEGHAHFLTCSCYRRLPLLTNDSWRTMLAESIRAACQKHHAALWAYVFMPEHIHLLLKPQRANYSLAAYEHDFKLASSRRIIAALAKSRSKLLDKLAIDKPARNARSVSGSAAADTT
jgi:putative transposase